MSDLELFVITSCRETFDYVMESVENQSVRREVTVVSDLPWIDALKYCATKSRSQFYLRIDDDMALHKHTVAYYITRIKRCISKKYGIYVCKLWEDWTKKPAGGLRMYSTSVARKIGFRPSRLGKVDKVFRVDMRAKGFEEYKDMSLVGLHMLNSEKTQKRLRAMWRKQAKSNKIFSASFDNIIHPCRMKVEEQFRVLGSIRSMNKRKKHPYFRFIKDMEKRP